MKALITNILLVVAALACAFFGSGCTYTHVPGVLTRVSVFQRTSASLDKTTSGTLHIQYGNDSQQAADMMQQVLALALAAGKVAAK